MPEAIFRENTGRPKDLVFLRSLDELTNESAQYPGFGKKTRSLRLQFPSLNIASVLLKDFKNVLLWSFIQKMMFTRDMVFIIHKH